ncbi:MAG: hypothetical protein ACXVAY_16750 [Mucilaginibacter sp.]
MKKLLLTTFLILSGIYVYAQKVELSVVANTGLFNYTGPSTATNSFITQSNDYNGNSANYTNNPYGNRKAWSYEVALQAQYVARSGFIIGLQTGYDILRSKTEITGVYPMYYYTGLGNFYFIQPVPVAATGQSYLQDKFINLNPYLGYRFNLKKIQLDIMPGADIGFNISSYDKGKATSSYDMVYWTNLKRPNAPTDVRLKMGIAAYYKRFGVNANYAYGLTNYEKNMIGDAVYDAKSRLIRFGISYRIL